MICIWLQMVYTLIDRLERVEIQRNELLEDVTNINSHSKSRFHLKWNLGELLFNRQRVN